MVYLLSDKRLFQENQLLNMYNKVDTLIVDNRIFR